MAARRRRPEPRVGPTRTQQSHSAASSEPLAASDGPRQARRALALALALAALVGVVHAPVLGHPFVHFDDPLFLTGNPALRLGLSVEGVRWAFGSFELANWFPLTWLSYLADYDLHGLSARGVHAGNLLLHATNAALLLLALVRMSGALGRSSFAAALFALHPLAVETVAWASERKGVLAATFWMAALLVHAGSGRAGPSARRQLAVATCMAVGLLAKSALVTLPFVLLLLDFWPLRRLEGAPGGRRIEPHRLWRCTLEKLPLLALAAASSWVTYLAQSRGGTTLDLIQLPFDQRVANAVVSYVRQLGHFVWPAGLCVYYPHPQDGLPKGVVTASAALLLALTVLCLAQRRARPWLIVGWLWFLGVFVPMLGLVQVGSQATADRYAYLPMQGLAIAAAWSLAEPAERLLARVSARRAALVLGVAALALLGALAAATRSQLGHWRSSVTLLARAVAVTERNPVAHAHLGASLLEEGRRQDALRHFRAALRLRPTYLEVLNNTAWLLATDPDEAIRDPLEAVRLARLALPLSGGSPAVLDTLAVALAAIGQYDEALGTARLARERAAAAGDAELAQALDARIALYASGRPYREMETAPPAR